MTGELFYGRDHQQRKYGADGSSRREMVEPWVRWVGPCSILDYGCGRSTLVHDVRCPTFEIRHRFNPPVPEYSEVPERSYDAIINADVMEHVDESEIEDILADIKKRCDQALFCICTQTATQFLPSGENAHATVTPGYWWQDRSRKTFPEARIFVKIAGL